jgi:predicted DCC family thiol-disulfide oxidoreductase YuxK
VEELETQWRRRFGGPPPLRLSPDLAREAYAALETAAPSALSLEAVVLRREADRACEELRAVRRRSQQLMAEARALACGRPLPPLRAAEED